MGRADHHLFFHEVVVQAGVREAVAQLLLAVCERRDLAHVRVDHGRADARECTGREQVFDDVDLRALAVQLQVDLVAFSHMLVEPVARANEVRGPVRPCVRELVGEHARADAADVVQLVRGCLVPQPVAADLDAPVAQGLERRPARGCGLKAEDAVEAVLRVADGVQRLAGVRADVEEDLHGVRTVSLC